jgi:hypothetical protein
MEGCVRSTPICRPPLRVPGGILFAAFIGSLLSGPPIALAAQQTATWAGGSGSWITASKWLENQVPNNGIPDDSTYSAIIPASSSLLSIVKLTTASTIDELTIGAGSMFDLNTSGVLTFAPAQAILTNHGTLSLASTATYSRLRFAGDRATLRGGGTVILRSTQLKPTNTPLTLVNEDNSIQGTGSIAGMDIINRGIIDANLGDRLSLYAAYPAANSPPYTLVNSGTLRASSGSTLTLNKAIYNNFEGSNPGRIIADGGTVEFQDVTLNGGEITVLGAGNMSLRGHINARVTNSPTGTILVTDQLGGTLINPAGGLVALTGKFTLTLDSKSTYNNAGTFVSATPLTGGPLYGGTIRLTGGPVAFRGGGLLALASDRSRIESDPASPSSLLLVDQTLNGYGQVTAPIINCDTIQADRPSGSLQCNIVTNYGTLKATNGGTLVATSVASYGDWLADGGTIQVFHGNTSGAIAVSNGGTFIASGRITSTNSIALTRSGTLRILQGFLRARNLVADSTSRLEFCGNTLEVTGDFSFAMQDEHQWRMDSSIGSSRLAMIGGIVALPGDWSHWASLEIGGKDLGDPSTLDRPP